MPTPFLYTPDSAVIWKTIRTKIEPVTLSSGFTSPALVKRTMGISHAQLFLNGLPALIPQERGEQEHFMTRLQRTYSRVTVVDFDCQIESASDEWKRKDVTTHLLTLTSGYLPPDPDLRSELRKSEREGLVIRQISSPDEIDQAIALLMMHGKGIHRLYPVSFLYALAHAADKHTDIIWLIALENDQIIATQIFLELGSTLLYWMSAMDRTFAAKKPAVALLHEGIKIGISDGVKQINFGWSPPETSGLVEFKKRWGAVEYQYPIFSYSPFWWPR